MEIKDQLQMNKLIRLALLGILFLFFSFPEAFGQTDLGVGFGYGSEIEEAGITLNAQFNIVSRFSLSPSFTYFFTEGSIDFSTINIDGHLNYEVGNGAILYPLFGLNLAFLSRDRGIFVEDDSDSELGVNLGGGVNYFFTRKLGFMGEMKFVLGDADQFVINLGMLFRL